MELDDPPHDPRRADPRDRHVAHRLRWGWGSNRRRDVRLVVGLSLAALVAVMAWTLLRTPAPLDPDGLAYVRETVDVTARTDAELQAAARAVCGVRDTTVGLDEVARRAGDEVAFTVSRRLASALREAGCPSG